MAENTEIAWCDSTFNPWIGCTKVGPGCDHCYAEADFDLRKHRVKWGPGNPRSRTSAENWKKPLQWNAQPFVECMACQWRGEARNAKIIENPAGFYPPVDSMRICPNCGEPTLKESRRRVFCASLADVFDNEVPVEWRRDLFDLIELTPNLDWLLLTKRIGNVQRMVSEARAHDWLAGRRNVWLGATICNQEEADRDIPKLLCIPASVRWISAEPLLGPIPLSIHFIYSDVLPAGGVRERKAIEWVVAGGESGPKARPMHPDWARSLRDQCADAGVPYLFKQWGEYLPITDAEARGFIDPGLNPVQSAMVRIGKKAAGRLLDGVLHDGYPEVRG